MLYQEIIRAKRDGHALDNAQIRAIVAGITDHSLNDAQLGAFAMAVLLRGMGLPERVALSEAMRDSGRVLGWDRGPVLDKHSTGGIGDTVSLLLAPMLAACGALVPMIAGRGLGHTGGTIDKLEAIPGYRTAPDIAQFQRVVGKVGCAIIGQSADLAPADRRFYGVRDVTATVESRDLITASILSKKLAAGLGSLVLDVKCGNGAFMASLPQAQALARMLAEVGTAAGCPTAALITDMRQPLASCAGNALETALAVALLSGRGSEPRLTEVTLALGAMALVQAGLAESEAEARAKLQTALDSGAAAERFAAMVSALGGPADLLERPAHYLPAAPVMRALPAPKRGVVAGYDTRAIGLTVIGLGGGRASLGDAIDPRVGLTGLLAIGTELEAGTPLAIIHAATDSAADQAEAALRAVIQLQDAPCATPPLVLDRITPPEIAARDA
ncbi:MAG: thymidine phosphorylase [Rhodobacteraceae bacterium]|nr:thymidine phosphorylase [Paracoccaceae bacterium]